MSGIINFLLKLIIVGCLIAGGALLFNSQNDNSSKHEETITNKKALALRNYLIKFNKPKSVEISNLSKRMNADAEEIKKITLPLDPNSKFYIAIDLFTDENDNEAPLIAQIKFFDLSSGNKVKEENINLD